MEPDRNDLKATLQTGSESDLPSPERLRRFVGYMFTRHDPAAQMPPVPEELSEWARDTMLATLAGMTVVGGRQWMQERSAGPIQSPLDAPTKAHAARAIAEEQTQRLARTSNAAVRGGLRIGGLAAMFYAAQLLSGIYRNKHDFYNTACAGTAAGAVLGLSLRAASGAARLRSAVLGAALGASVGVPAGMLQDKVAALLPPEQQERRRQRLKQTEDIIAGKVAPERPRSAPRSDPAAAVINQLERSLATSPTRSSPNRSAEGAAEDATEKKSAWWKFI